MWWNSRNCESCSTLRYMTLSCSSSAAVDTSHYPFCFHLNLVYVESLSFYLFFFFNHHMTRVGAICLRDFHTVLPWNGATNVLHAVVTYTGMQKQLSSWLFILKHSGSSTSGVCIHQNNKPKYIFTTNRLITLEQQLMSWQHWIADGTTRTQCLSLANILSRM